MGGLQQGLWEFSGSGLEVLRVRGLLVGKSWGIGLVGLWHVLHLLSQPHLPFLIVNLDSASGQESPTPSGASLGPVRSGVQAEDSDRWLHPVTDTSSEKPLFPLRAFPQRPLLPEEV